MPGGLDVNFNYSWPTGANAQLGIVPTQILPQLIPVFRYKTKMLRLISKDWSQMVAQAGDTVVYEKLTGSTTAVDLTTATTINFSSAYTITKDSIVLDRYIGFPFFVKELEQLLAFNSGQKWDNFIRATIDTATSYIEDDVAGLYASMPNTYPITGGLNKTHFPILEDRITASSYDDEGPWVFLVSRYDWLNLISDTDLQNQQFSATTQVLREANIFKLSNINTFRWRYVPDVTVTTPGTYNTMYHNILFNSRAIQFVPRRLGVPKLSANDTMFVEVADPESGLIYRIRFIFDGKAPQPGWNVMVELLYGVKLVFPEYAYDVSTLHTI